MLEKENCFISYKTLTEADMGRSIRSHQTHIGLFEDSFLFLPDDAVIDNCYFLFSGNIKKVPLLYGRMLSASSGHYRSPKIRKGDGATETILSVIRNIAADNLELDDFYLLWFALPNEEIVFWLIMEDSSELNALRNLDLLKDTKGRYAFDSKEYQLLQEYIKDNYGNVIFHDSPVEEDVIPEVSDLEDESDVAGAKDSVDNIDKPVTLYKNHQLAIEHFLNQEILEGRIQKYALATPTVDVPYDFTYYDLEGKTVFCSIYIARFESDTKLSISSDFIYFYERNKSYKFNLIYLCERSDGSYMIKICKAPKKELDLISNAMLGASKDLAKSVGAVIEKFQIMADVRKFEFSEYFRL